MPMKKILQALDRAASKPVGDSTDMKKFMSVVSEGSKNNQLSMAEQMTMQHYSSVPIVEQKKPARDSVLRSYFKLAEDEIAQAATAKRALINQYAKVISNRVRLKESKIKPDQVVEQTNPPDAVTVDIPLLIRLFEYAREDAETDVDLHDVAERMIALSQQGRTLTMDDYAEICTTEDQRVDEGNDPCWSTYKQIGTKNKNGKTVPNCVPKKK